MTFSDRRTSSGRPSCSRPCPTTISGVPSPLASVAQNGNIPFFDTRQSIHLPSGIGTMAGARRRSRSGNPHRIHIRGRCRMGKRGLLLALVLGMVLVLSSGASAEVSVPESSRGCVSCHVKEKVAATAIEEWRNSTHAKEGVGCLDCHEAEKGKSATFEHHGSMIHTIVTPNDCARCHEKESRQFQASHHANAGEILGSLDNFLGEVVEGPPAAISGCQQCHGGTVKVLASGKIDPTTWPNTGIGRINPDGSKGACSACHSRHLFSAKVARSPESCGKCHLGPDHPQKEIYDESKHGIAFYANRDRMNLDSRSWVVGKDYTAAPTCSTCHLSATADLPVTHDPGERLSWTLRPAVSKKMENWEKKRATMKQVCGNCHDQRFVGSFYTQFDITVD